MIQNTKICHIASCSKFVCSMQIPGTQRLLRQAGHAFVHVGRYVVTGDNDGNGGFHDNPDNRSLRRLSLIHIYSFYGSAPGPGLLP